MLKLLPLDYGVRNIGRSPMRLFGTILGSTIVVLLVLAAASFIAGMKRSLVLSSQQENVLLLSTGSEESIERSEISANSANLLAASVSGIKERLRIPYVSPEINLALIIRETQNSTQELRALFRGVTPNAFLVHPRVEIIAGKAPQAGHDEIMVGALAANKINLDPSKLAINKSLWFANRKWKIVGHFRATATVMDAEIWIPLTDLQIATKREGLSTVVVTLGEAEFDDIDVFTKQRIDLELVAIRESDYYAALMRFYRPVQIMIWVTAILISLSGLLGGLNVMYAAFANRVREIGMLQSLGYSRLAIVISMIQESLLSSCTGTLIGTGLSFLLINGQAVRFSMGVFQLQIDPQVLLFGLSAGILMGLVGAIPPAYNCLRLPITEALKAS